MNTTRYKNELSRAFYHIFDRINGRQFLLTDQVKDFLRKTLYKVAFFCGVEVITYALMTDHFHILIMVPPKSTSVSEDEVIARVAILYGFEKSQWLKNKLEFFRETGRMPEAEELLNSYRYRMDDVSEFMKCLKSRITIYYNHKFGRDGTLWEHRFNSIILEDLPNVSLLRAVAAYIDLNPVRAKMVPNPKSYGWNGCHDPLFTKNLTFLFPSAKKEDCRRLYNDYLEGRMHKKGYVKTTRDGLPDLFETRIKNVLFTRCRAIGSPAFIAMIAGEHPPGGVTPFMGDTGSTLLVVGRLTRRKKRCKEA